jgi:hypothetical protein
VLGFGPLRMAVWESTLAARADGQEFVDGVSIRADTRPLAKGPEARSDRSAARSRGRLDTNAITSRYWARTLWRFSGRDGIVEYALNDQGSGRRYLPMSLQEQRFVRRTFRLVDRLTGLSFVETDSLSQADIRVHSARKLGRSEGVAILRNGWFDAIWKDRNGSVLTRFEKYLIRHEIGHVLGLEHPYGRGAHPRYDTKDTLMSYNWRGNTMFSRSDIQALQALWGESFAG